MGFKKAFTRKGVNLFIARTAYEAINFMSHAHFDMVFLDHDLGLTPVPDPGDGTQVVSWVVGWARRGRFQHTKFYIHSANDERAIYMLNTLKQAGLNVKDTPSLWEQLAQVATA